MFLATSAELIDQTWACLLLSSLAQVFHDTVYVAVSARITLGRNEYNHKGDDDETVHLDMYYLDVKVES